jgi:hypothetical protein
MRIDVGHQPSPLLTLDDLVDLLDGELDDLDNGLVWGADHADAIRSVRDRLAWIVRGRS